MRVALFSYSAQTGDAVGNHVARQLRFFLGSGAEVRVFLHSGQRIHPGAQPHATILAGDRPVEADRSYLAAADLVVVHYSISYPLIWWLPLLAGNGTRILIDYHGVTPQELWDTPHRERLRQAAANRSVALYADLAVAHSNFTVRELIDHTGMPADRVVCLGLPVDTGRFAPAPPRRDLRDRLGLGRSYVLLFVGRAAPHKRLPVLVEALAHLRDRFPAVHAVAVGDTTDLFAAEKSSCEKRAFELGVADRIHFIGVASDSDLLDAYRSADALVMPSRHEGFCVPVAEAMACGVPVIAARAGALVDTVGNAGLLFEPDDAGQLAKQINQLQDDGFAKQLSELGRMRAAEFDDSVWEKRFASLVDQLVHGPQREIAERVVVKPRYRSRRVSTDVDCLLVPVRLINRGSHPLVPEGPARWSLRADMTDETGTHVGESTVPTPLSSVLRPGESEDFLVAVPVPPHVGRYRVHVHAEQPERTTGRGALRTPQEAATAAVGSVRLAVTDAHGKDTTQALRERIEMLLVQAERLKALPDDYIDVSEGWLAGWKRRIKAKLLGNFKHAYIDPLSRQQSAFNDRVLAVVHEVAELQSRLQDSLKKIEQEKRAAEIANRPRRWGTQAHKAKERA